MPNTSPVDDNSSILPHELPGALGRVGDRVKVLSLDCFDTLLWRDCHAPSDVFYALPKLSIGQRIAGEKMARKAQIALKGRSEVGLEAIYAHAMPNADGPAIAGAVEAELEAEARSCFAFAPTTELMRAAKAQGLKVIIVSDTYLSERQLRDLIERAAGNEVAGLIDKVFVSSENGVSKSQGLLGWVLKSLKVAANEVLHIGDNKSADFEASRALGVPALHLVQFSQSASQRLRFERACQRLAGERGKDVRVLMPHRALLAIEEPKSTSRASALGTTVLGPVFYAFDQWLRAEAKALQSQRGGRVHWVFMLRDGHLPHIVHQACGEAENTALAEISRFAAIAASLTTKEAYTKHFSTELGRKPSTLARQMLLTEDEITRIVGEDRTEQQMQEGSQKLGAELKKGKVQKVIRGRARERADRLVAHVRARVNPAPGDTLMLVDLGYNGSAQNHVDALLSQAFDCHVAGRYLIYREHAVSGLDKRGLIDERHYDLELVESLCGNVAVIEQLATCALGSVRDFTSAGEPIREKATVKGAQSEVRDEVQAGTVHYAKAAKAGCIIRQEDASISRALRDGALGVLARFMFMPHASELEVLKSFEHDVNMGSDRMVPLFDQARAKEGMRRRGLFYMEGSKRMFLPAELEGEDIHTRLSLMVQKRFGLGLTYSDVSGQPIAIPAFFMGATGSAQWIVHAQPTHEGFYSAKLPIPRGVQSIGLGVGSVFEWFELSTVCITSVETLKGGLVNDEAVEELGVQMDGLKIHAPGIHECTGTAAFLLVKAPPAIDEEAPQMIEIVMRPIIRRKEVVSVTDAALSASSCGHLKVQEQAA